MTSTAIEFEHLTAPRQKDLFDTTHEDRFDRVVRLAQRFFNVPIVAVNLVDDTLLCTKAGVGIAEPEIPREGTFCAQVVDEGQALHVFDAREHPRYRDAPFVASPGGIRFYAGQPLHSANGQRIGSLCMMGHEPRELTLDELEVLRDLAEWVEKEIANDEELGQAGAVQRRLCPRTNPLVPGYEVSGMCVPARTAGGDFFDWYVAEGQLQVALADVMGKGVGAALIAAGVRAVLRGASRYNPLDEAITRSAASLEDDLEDTGTFVTAFAARMDLSTGAMDYVDAGHGLAVVFEKDGGYRRLRGGGIPLGAFPGETWSACHTVLEPGETLLMASDGMLDYYPDLWLALETAQLTSATTSNAEEFLDEVRGVAGAQSHQDDVTAVIVRRLEDDA